MANHGPSYGMDAELAQKRQAQYNPGEEDEARQFIESRTGTSIGSDFHGGLKSGEILCHLANSLKPNSCKIGKGKMPFVQMENISQYLAFCPSMGLKTHDLFQTVDLFEAKNMNQVVKNILALKRASGGGIAKTVSKPAMVDVFESAAQHAPASSGGGAKFCSNCGTKAAGGKFCASCGTGL